MSWSDVRVHHTTVVETHVDTGIVQPLVLVLILVLSLTLFWGCYRPVFSHRTGFDLSGQAEEYPNL